MPQACKDAPLGQRQGGVFRLPPPYLWTPPTPQRAKGCTPLTILKKKSKHKKASAAPVGAIALTLFSLLHLKPLSRCATAPPRGSGTPANFALQPETFPPCQRPHPRGGCHRAAMTGGVFSRAKPFSTFLPSKVKNPAEKRSRWFKKQFGCVILEAKVPVGRGNWRARLRVPRGTKLSPGGRKARGKNCSDRKPEGRSG